MRLLGVFGHPITHSLSPKMHNAALKAAGLEREYVYLPFDIPDPDLASAVNALRVLNAKGANVTIPHKEAVIPFVDELDFLAKTVGAVNVIVNHEGRLTGHNTDGIGFIRSLKEDAGVEPKDKKILVLGAGGAAKAVCAALAVAGVKEIFIVNRTINRAQMIEDMVKRLGACSMSFPFSFDGLKEVIAEAQIIINTTSVGLYPVGVSLLTPYQKFLHPDQLVCDIIYNPQETLLLNQAKARGCRILSGMGMLLFQGAEAFRLWTGVDAPVDVMRKALEEGLDIVDS